MLALIADLVNPKRLCCRKEEWYQSTGFMVVAGAVVVIVGFIMILLLLGFVRLWIQSLLTGARSACSTWSA